MATTQTSTFTVSGATWQFQNIDDYNTILARLQSNPEVTITNQDTNTLLLTFDYTATVAAG